MEELKKLKQQLTDCIISESVNDRVGRVTEDMSTGFLHFEFKGELCTISYDSISDLYFVHIGSIMLNGADAFRVYRRMCDLKKQNDIADIKRLIKS